MQKAREKIRPPKGGQNLVKVLAICHLPLWNVNVINSWLLKWKSNELIDTLWNVNNEETNTEENKTEN